LIIRKLAFARLAREICQDLQTDTRLSSTAIEALQEAAEAMLVSIFQDANLNAIKNERFTVNSKDMAVAQLVMKYGPDAAGEV
ncbi:putative histone H3, partial [Cadophora sp. DSE1049]